MAKDSTFLSFCYNVIVTTFTCLQVVSGRGVACSQPAGRVLVLVAFVSDLLPGPQFPPPKEQQ